MENVGTKNKRIRPLDAHEPERRRLQEAQAHSTSALFLPSPDSIGIGKFNVASNINGLKSLFYLVVFKVKGTGVTWGEGQDADPRRRMYGFMPRKRDALINEGIQIQKFGAKDIQEHEDALKLASVDLVFGGDGVSSDTKNEERNGMSHTTNILLLDESILTALKSVTEIVHDLVPSQYKKYATIEQLVAVQPNLHNGASYLPAHLDFPRNDGFGVIIVTIGIRGSGEIILIDDGDEEEDVTKSYSFDMEEGEAYILCGDARNKCTHGVLCDNKSSRRETLNLRYGLHSAKYAHDEIDQYWPD